MAREALGWGQAGGAALAPAVSGEPAAPPPVRSGRRRVVRASWPGRAPPPARPPPPPPPARLRSPGRSRRAAPPPPPLRRCRPASTRRRPHCSARKSNATNTLEVSDHNARTHSLQRAHPYRPPHAPALALAGLHHPRLHRRVAQLPPRAPPAGAGAAAVDDGRLRGVPRRAALRLRIARRLAPRAASAAHAVGQRREQRGGGQHRG